MSEERLEGHSAGHRIDLCLPASPSGLIAESLHLSPASTLRLFRIVGDRAAPPARARSGVLSAMQRPCGTHHDMQRTTRFEYLSCPNGTAG